MKDWSFLKKYYYNLKGAKKKGDEDNWIFWLIDWTNFHYKKMKNDL